MFGFILFYFSITWLLSHTFCAVAKPVLCIERIVSLLRRVRAALLIAHSVYRFDAHGAHGGCQACQNTEYREEDGGAHRCPKADLKMGCHDAVCGITQLHQL